MFCQACMNPVRVNMRKVELARNAEFKKIDKNLPDRNTIRVSKRLDPDKA